MATVSDFATSVQLHGQTMALLTRNKSGWVHFWKDIDTFEGGQRGRGSSSAAPAIPSDVAASDASKDAMLKAMQSQLDRTKAQLAKANSRGNGNGGGNGASGSGDSKAAAAAGAKKRARGNRKKDNKRTVTVDNRA